MLRQTEEATEEPERLRLFQEFLSLMLEVVEGVVKDRLQVLVREAQEVVETGHQMYLDH